MGSLQQTCAARVSSEKAIEKICLDRNPSTGIIEKICSDNTPLALMEMKEDQVAPPTPPCEDPNQLLNSCKNTLSHRISQCASYESTCGGRINVSEIDTLEQCIYTRDTVTNKLLSEAKLNIYTAYNYDTPSQTEPCADTTLLLPHCKNWIEHILSQCPYCKTLDIFELNTLKQCELDLARTTDKLFYTTLGDYEPYDYDTYN